jgi:hypothetical protein
LQEGSRKKKKKKKKKRKDRPVSKGGRPRQDPSMISAATTSNLLGHAPAGGKTKASHYFPADAKIYLL